MDRTLDRVLTGLVSALGVIGVMATIHSISDASLRWWYSGAALTAVLGTVLLVAPRVFPNIKGISRRPAKPIDEELGNAKEVWITLHSGSVKYADEDLLKTRRKLRVVITDPDSSALAEVAKIVNRPLNDMASDIRGLTSRLKDTGNEVRWFDGPIANAILLADPSLPSAWARIEVLVPFAAPTDRPSLIAYSRRNPEFVEKAKASFESLWARSNVK